MPFWFFSVKSHPLRGRGVHPKSASFLVRKMSAEGEGGLPLMVENRRYSFPILPQGTMRLLFNFEMNLIITEDSSGRTFVGKPAARAATEGTK